jgi:predicted CoA-binding protein
MQSAIESFIAEPALAIVGVRRSGRGFGNTALQALTAKGYRVYPVHPTAAFIDGLPCHRSFADLPERVNAVLVVVPPAQAVGVVREAAAAGIRHVWLQQGAESPWVLHVCADLGLQAVSGECILMYTKPSGVHRVHRWLHDVFAA